MDKAIDFDRVAQFYDAHVTTTEDLEFWLTQCRLHRGPHCELMCGTGRISISLLRNGIPLTCVDYSTQMLARLRAKLEIWFPRAELVDADVRELSLPRRYGFVFIGFQAIAELVEPDDLARAFARIAALLEPGGTVMISMHEPRARGPECDGQWVDLGTHTIAEASSPVSIRGRWSLGDAGLVTGAQIYAVEGHEPIELAVRFRLHERQAIYAAAIQAGLEPGVEFGGYAIPGSPPSATCRVRILGFRRPLHSRR